MIYTVTMNPSLDYVLYVDNFQLGEVNRSSREEIIEGGKGINVSIVLKNLGIDSVALGFIAGFTGSQIEQRMKQHGVVTDFIEVEHGISRINVKLKGKEESEINGQGPRIEAAHVQKLYEQLEHLQEGDIVVLAGSVPNSLPSNLYESIMKRWNDKRISFVVDATKDLLRNVLKYHPFLVKPNHHELGELYGVTLATQEEVIPYAKRLQEEGARNVLISMAGDGAVFVDSNHQVYTSKAPKGKVINSVGAGDSMVAGFLYGYQTTKQFSDAFYYGIATGSASAFSAQLATKPEVLSLYQQIKQ